MLTPLAILLIILRIFPILSWIILSSIVLHLLLAMRQGLLVPKDLLFLELVLGFLAVLPLGLFQKPLLLLFCLCSLLLFGGYLHFENPRRDEDVETVKPKVKKTKENNVKKRDVEEEKLEEQSKQLEVLAKKDCRGFVEELLKTFPPVHQPSGKWENLEVKEIKMENVLRKVISMYHPDKVDKVKHGEKYYVLCERITAQLNVKYLKYK